MNFKSLVDAHYAALYRFAFTLAKNEHEAADLTQQTFAVFAEKGNTLRDPSKVKSWLFTTLYREFLRGRKRERRIDYRESEVLELEAPTVAPDLIRAMDAKQALQALQELDPLFRAPLVLYYLQDHSYKEIAEILDVPIGTVMSRLSRAKAQLKSQFLGKDRESEE